MSELYQVFNVTGPIFVIILIGYLAVKYSIVPQGSSQALSSFAINFALPALLFKAISEKPVAEVFNPEYLMGYAGGSLLAFALLFFLSMKLRKNSISHSAIFAMGGSLSNNLMIGFPVIIELFGNVAMVPLALTLMVESFIILPVSLIMADAGVKFGQNRLKVLLLTFRQVLQNPIIVATILGIVFSYLQFSLPQPMMKVIDLFSETVSGIALFATGGLLVGIRIRSVAKDLSLILPTKLIIHPLMVLLVFSFIPGMEPLLFASAIILASMPMFGSYPIIAEKYGLGQTCAAVLVPTIVLSFITLNTVVWLVDIYLPIA
ncbi:MAG: AEC family transporter [Amphritea sp.]